MASRNDEKKPIQLQKGLSNFSSLQLGDDRIMFNESILSGTYRVNVEDKMTIPSPSKDKSVNYRRRDYDEALEKVGDVEVNRLERVMKDKLFQRSYMTSSPFQVRKAFKFFDRELKMTIPIEGFTRALEFLGFQFSERQNIALFGRYDTEVSGEIDYMNFIAKAMFYGDADWLPVPKTDLIKKKRAELEKGKPKVAAASGGEHDKQMRLAEFKRLFDKASIGASSLNKAGFDIFMMALGHQKGETEIDVYFRDMGIPEGQGVTFDLFCDWYESGFEDFQ